MGGYHRRRMQVAGPERFSDKAEKNEYSHIHDALQYGMVKYFGGGLTRMPAQNDDFPAADYGRNDQGRSTVTGY